MGFQRTTAAVVASVLLASLMFSSVQAFGPTTRISVGPGGIQGNAQSQHPSVNANGQYTAFQSEASNLVAGDSNGFCDIFVYNRLTGINARVSVDSNGNEGNGDSQRSSISHSGLVVAFVSTATNLVTGDANGHRDIFVHDSTSGTTYRASVDSSGTEANGVSSEPCISANGRMVFFSSDATNLVAGDGNGFEDVFMHDHTTGQTTMLSVNSGGTQGNGPSNTPSPSADSRYVAFMSSSSNLVAGDSNGKDDIFVRDRTLGTTTRVSIASNGTEGNMGSYYPSISADGRYVAFQSFATNLVPNDTNGCEDVFVHDRTTGTTARVSVDSSGIQGNRGSFEPSISADGRYVSFYSSARNLVPGDTNAFGDVFIHDCVTGATTRVSLDSNGNQGDRGSYEQYISADGHYIAFQSDSTNLVPNDTNGVYDVFLVALFQPQTTGAIMTSLGTVSFNINAGSLSNLANIKPADMICPAPAGYILPYGMFGFNITGLTTGQQVAVIIRFPNPLPLGAKYYKCINGSLADCSSIVTRINEYTLQLNLTDGGPFDADGLSNGVIVDPGGPAFPLSTPQSSSAQMPATPQAPVSLSNITVKSASLSAAKVTPGTLVTVTANVANTGTGNGSSVIRVYVNGAEDTKQGVTVNSGGTTTVTFDVSRNEPGSYTVYVGGTEAGSFTVDSFTPDTILFISGALILFAIAGGAVWLMRRRA